jgi:hypothetical protein
MAIISGPAKPLTMKDAAGVFQANCHERLATCLKMKGFAVRLTLTVL